MLPILEAMDEVGFHSLECWGGATFDACLRFLDEDPWERLRVIKNHVARTPLQMLLRGQNLVGYRHYGDDIVRRFVLKAAENGIDVFRVFDALNDMRNFETAAAAIKEAGKHFQAAVVYTISPVHSLDHYLEVAHQLVDMGADCICIKDMAALLSPFYAEQLITRLKDEIPVPVQLHCHYIGGLAPMTYLKAIEAGVDVIDTATVPLAFGNSQPATEMVVTALIGTPYDSGARPGEALPHRQVLRGRAPAAGLRARRHLAHAHAGVLAPGAGRHDQQPGEPAQGAERARPAARGAARRSPSCAPRSAFRRWSRP